MRQKVFEFISNSSLHRFIAFTVGTAATIFGLLTSLAFVVQNNK